MSGRGEGRTGAAAAMHALRGDRAQATVEMAIVAPVLLVLALIVYNVMLFTSATARFDRVAPDIVLAHGTAPAEGEDGLAVTDASAQVAAQLERAMDGYDLEIEVACMSGGEEGGSVLALAGSLRTYTCTMRFAPWPSGLAIAGVSMGAPAFLVHERSVTIDPWRPAVIA